MREVNPVERKILHSDVNSFYASVEMLYHPEHAGKPLAVGGAVSYTHLTLPTT